MKKQGVLTDYLDAAMASAVVSKLPDGTLGGRIPCCAGVVAFGKTATQCKRELRATLEGWLLLGLKLGHDLPVIAGIDLNREPQGEPLESMRT
jgi:hypothetical protein